MVERGDCLRAFVPGEWPVVKEAKIYREPNTESTLLATLKPSASVTASICEWHSVPGVAQIISEPYYTTKDLDRGKPVYIFENYEGGRTRVFQNGKFYVTKIATKRDECKDYDDPYRCWAKVLRERQHFTWANVKVMETNIEGWVLLGEGSIVPTPLPPPEDANTH